MCLSRFIMLRGIPVAAGVLLAVASPAAGHVGLDDPNGGEVLKEGNVFTVRWTILIAHTLLNWDLWYWTTGAGGPWVPLATNLPPGSPAVGSVHTYNWTVPDLLSTQVRVRVRMDNSGTDYYDISDADFTVTRAGDLDSDADVDLTDYGTFADCVSGPGVNTAPPACTRADFAAADLDGDGDVDLRDYDIFAENFTG
ncbi:MAG: hypothetical protein ACYSUQ_15150 [Planctomycetota bacterium]